MTSPHRVVGVVCTLAVLLQLTLPAPAYAWWGWLEKMSGPSGINGPQFDFRVACVGDLPKGAVLAKEAAEHSLRAAGTEPGSAAWRVASNRWEAAARAWASFLETDFVAPAIQLTVAKTSDFERYATDLRAMVETFERLATPVLMATSSAGVLWSFCKPEKERRFALDVGWGIWSNEGSVEYAGDEPIRLDTLMASVSWRVFSDPRWDVLQASAGAGAYWFTSKGFPGHDGVVLQPGRLTVRAPSSWSRKSAKGWQRLLALPVYGVGITVFPAGFEATDFAGVDRAAARIPSELLVTHYLFFNWQPLLHLRSN